MAPVRAARFFACYVLTPVLPPQRLRCTYVGFTVAPFRRLRQHNGEISSGAWRTRKHRPWFVSPPFEFETTLMQSERGRRLVCAHPNRWWVGGSDADREMVAVVHGFPSKTLALQCTY